MSAIHTKSGGDNPKSRSSSRMSSQVDGQSSPDSEVETVNLTTPLMGNNNKNNKPSLATPEIDETDDEREVVTKPYPGVDDGFFDKERTDKSDTPNSKPDNPEIVPNSEGADLKPVTPDDLKPNQYTPDNTDPSGDDADGGVRPRRPSVTFPHFPRESDYGHHNHQHDLEIGNGILEDMPDINVYQHKKTLAQGMMDLALFSANANQLRYVLDSYDRHPYYYPSMIFICISLFIQVAIGVLLIWNATYNVKDEKEVCRANKINNYTVIGIFLVTVVNVFISAFGVADPPTPTQVSVVSNST